MSFEFGMRNAFADELTKLAAEDTRLVLLSGDIGNRLFDGFKLVDVNRFYNCGVAEQNMMGVAAGMALSGLRPVVYTITPFTTTRCFEQIRDDVCYHEAPVIIVGTALDSLTPSLAHAPFARRPGHFADVARHASSCALRLRRIGIAAQSSAERGCASLHPDRQKRGSPTSILRRPT